jgi:hypothetical protein
VKRKKIVYDDEGVLSQKTIRRLEKASKEVKEGKFITHDEVKKKLGL